MGSAVQCCIAGGGPAGMMLGLLLTQRFQVLVQSRILQRVLEDDDTGQPFRPPLAARLLGRFRLLRRIPARMIGMGARPEHIESPAASLPVTA